MTEIKYLNDSKTRGKSIFFVCPNQATKEKLVHQIFKHEYIVYTVESLEKMKNLAKYFDDAIIFINIDAFESSGDEKESWQQAIKTIFAENTSKQIKIGIITQKEDPALKHKFIFESKINSPYIQFSKDAKECLNLIMKALKIYRVKGFRQYVRANCEQSDAISVEFNFNGKQFISNVTNISSSSIAIHFDDSIELPLHYEIDPLIIHFSKSDIKAKVKVFGARNTEIDGKNYKELIMIFNDDEKWRQSDELQFLYSQIYNLIQKEIDE